MLCALDVVLLRDCVLASFVGVRKAFGHFGRVAFGFVFQDIFFFWFLRRVLCDNPIELFLHVRMVTLCRDYGVARATPPAAHDHRGRNRGHAEGG